jgi:hypothetical protein
MKIHVDVLMFLTRCWAAVSLIDTVRGELGRQEITVLMGSDAHIKGVITERISGDHVHKLWMENWSSPDDSLAWHLNVPADMAGDYHARLLAASHFKMASVLHSSYDVGSSPVTVELLVLHGDDAGMHTTGGREGGMPGERRAEREGKNSGEGVAEEDGVGVDRERGGKGESCAVRDSQGCMRAEGRKEGRQIVEERVARGGGEWEIAGKVMSRVQHTIRYTEAPTIMSFERHYFEGTLYLPAGSCTLVLRAVKAPEEGAMNLQLLSVEIAHKSTLDDIEHDRLMLRADASWLQQAGYGLFFHWNRLYAFLVIVLYSTNALLTITHTLLYFSCRRALLPGTGFCTLSLTLYSYFTYFTHLLTLYS